MRRGVERGAAYRTKEVSVRGIWAVAGIPQSASSFGIGISMIVCASMRTLAAALAGSGKLCLRWACLPPVGTRDAYEKRTSILASWQVPKFAREESTEHPTFVITICLPFSA